MYAVAIKTDDGIVVCHLPRKIGSLFSVSALEWYDRPKLAHGSVKFGRLSHCVCMLLYRARAYLNHWTLISSMWCSFA